MLIAFWVLFSLIIAFILLQEVAVFSLFLQGGYETKAEFLFFLIPIYPFIYYALQVIREEWHKLK